MRRPISLAAVLTFLACGPQEVPTTAVHHAAATVPAQGTSSTLDLANWNIEWFGSKSNGPRNEDQQLLNARDVIAGADLDAWGLAEIVDNAHFDNLVAQLPGYAGFLANDPIVTSGSSWYDSGELKLGFLYKTSVITVNAAKVILTENNYDFAGRPPLRVDVTATVNGASSDLVVIVLHMKAFNDEASWQRRKNASDALKAYLDANLPTQDVIVLGDWNDDIDESITTGLPSPFDAFLNDAADYTFVTTELTQAGVSTTCSYSDTIDHQLATNDLVSDYETSSVHAFREVESHISNYCDTTSDHYPVYSRYTLSGSGGGGGSNAAPTASFTWACTELACEFSDASADSDGSVVGWSWAFGDGSTSTAQHPAHTYAAGGSYTVTLTVTDEQGATATTSQTVSVSSASSGISLAASSYKRRGVGYVDLTWSGATSTSVDVLRNGQVVSTTANDGAYTDNVGKGSASYQYVVCEAGTSTCSNEVTVTF